LDPKRLAGFGVTPLMVHKALAGADASLKAGGFNRANRFLEVTSDSFLTGPARWGTWWWACSRAARSILRMWPRCWTGRPSRASYTRIGFSRRYLREQDQDPGQPTHAAVTLELAKKAGTNAVEVAKSVIRRMEQLKAEVLPTDVEVTITRDYGATAQDKSDELMRSLDLR
jgi:multidrug efflux pump subunit AcrB